MARPRGTVQESLKALRELEARHEGTPLETRVRVLRLLKEQPELTLSDVGPMVGKSERSVQRWWETYQKQGISALMQLGQRGGRPKRIDTTSLEALQQKLEVSGFSGLKEAQEWLRTEHNLSYSRSGLWHLMRSTLNAAPKGWALLHDSGEINAQTSPVSAAGSASGSADAMLRFMNSLPTSSDTIDWVTQFRDALRELLGDVDRVSVNVNRDCDLSNPEEYKPRIAMTQISDGEAEEQAVSVAAERRENKPFERILEGMRRQNFPFNQYHSPQCFDYYFGGQAYLGSILLWRAIEKTPISERTIDIVKGMQTFFLFALSDHVARYQAEKPIDRVFHDALEDLVAEAGLSPQEERIVVLQLMGHSYKEMADLLAVTVDTVKKHFKQIHRKTGTRGQAELFAKYFTSRLIPDNLRDEPER